MNTIKHILSLKIQNELCLSEERINIRGGDDVNPILIFGAVLVTVILWFLLTFLFQPLGKFLLRIIDDTIEAMEDDEKHKEKEKKKNEKR